MIYKHNCHTLLRLLQGDTFGARQGHIWDGNNTTKNKLADPWTETIYQRKYLKMRVDNTKYQERGKYLQYWVSMMMKVQLCYGTILNVERIEGTNYV